MRRVASAFPAFALLACAAPAIDAIDSGTRAPRVELGTGEVAFAAIPPSGGTLELVHGPQGGYHVFVAARLWDLELDRVELIYEVERRGGESLSRTAFVLDAARFVREGDHVARYGDLAILDIAMPDAVAGDEVIVRVVATDTGGSSAHDERVVQISDAI